MRVRGRQFALLPDVALAPYSYLLVAERVSTVLMHDR